MSGRIVGFAGSWSNPSRTRLLVETAVDRAAARFGRDGLVFDLGSLLPSLGTAARLSDLDAPAAAAVQAIVDFEALVVASPVYKGSYTGLFKHLFDLLDPLALAGKPILLERPAAGRVMRW